MKRLGMQACIVRIDVLTSSSRVGAIFFVLRRIGHGGVRVIFNCNCVIPVDICTSELYAYVSG